MLFRSANANPGSTVFFPAGTYTITSTITLNNVNVIGVGSATRLIGSISALGSSNPMFVLTSICTIKNVFASFDSRPSSASSGQYVIFRCGDGSNPLQRYSNIDSVWTYYCGTAFYCPTGVGSVFSTTFSNLRVEFFVYRGFDFRGTDRTGNIYSNIYATAGISYNVSNNSYTISTGSKTFNTIYPTTDFIVGQIATIAGNPTTNAMYGTVTAITSSSLTINVTSTIGSGAFSTWAITARNTCNCTFALSGIETECTINQLNSEHSYFTQAAIIFDNVYGLAATSIHIEQIEPASNNLPYVYTNSASGVIDAISYLGNFYPQYINPAPETGTILFQLNSCKNYLGIAQPLTANYFNIGVFNINNYTVTNNLVLGIVNSAHINCVTLIALNSPTTY